MILSDARILEEIEKGTIKITYTAPAVGAFKKKVTVKFAGVKVPTELTIEGEVI